MMNQELPLPRYLQEQADELNRLARSIDTSLFCFCNYEEESLPSFSPYDEFLLGILQLYKFAVDCCPLRELLYGKTGHYKNLEAIVAVLPVDLRQEYRNIQNDIQVLRAVCCHNNSENNGGFQIKNLNQFSATFIRVTGHELNEPGLCSEAFVSACWQLHRYAENLATFIRNFLRSVEESENKTELIYEWRSCILYWYSNNTKRQYFLSYIDPNITFGSFSRYIVRDRSDPRKVRSLKSHLECIIQRNEQCIRELNGCNGENAWRFYRNGYERGLNLSAAQKASTVEEAKKRLENVNVHLAVASNFPDKKNPRYRNYGDYFLGIECQTALFKATRQLYPNCSLLPQEFYDYVVYKLLRLR